MLVMWTASVALAWTTMTVLAAGLPEVTAHEEHQHPRCTQQYRSAKCKHSATAAVEPSSLLIRYYYNQTAGECRQFAWSGCHISGNNFFTMNECRFMCSGHTPQQPTSALGKKNSACAGRSSKKCRVANRRRHGRRLSFCDDRRDAGPCQDVQHRFHYNASSEQCEPFVYGGCGGNKNRFDTLEECSVACEL